MSSFRETGEAKQLGGNVGEEYFQLEKLLDTHFLRYGSLQILVVIWSSFEPPHQPLDPSCTAVSRPVRWNSLPPSLHHNLANSVINCCTLVSAQAEMYVRYHFSTRTELWQRTSESVNGKESLRIATGDVIRQTTIGGVIEVGGQQLDHLGALVATLQHGWVVDRLRSLRPVVIDIIDLDQHVDERAAWNSGTVVSVHSQPVVRLSLAVKYLLHMDHT